MDEVTLSDLKPNQTAHQVPALSGAEARFHHFRVGAIEAVAVSDGGIPIPSPPGTDSSPGLRALACLLLRMPETGQLLLIDTGFGPTPKRAGNPLPTAGKLLLSMAGAGVQPEDVDVVLISHIHPDHVDGLFDDQGSKTFPNASYHVGVEELAFWSQDNLDLSDSPAPPSLKQHMVGSAKRMLGFANGQLSTFRAGEEALPGVGTLLLPGHTPGQVGFMVSSGDDKLLYTADAFTTPEMSFDAPERHNPFDLDPVEAVKTRHRLLETLSTQGWHSFTPHFPWPNVGRVKADGKRFVWASAA